MRARWAAVGLVQVLVACATGGSRVGREAPECDAPEVQSYLDQVFLQTFERNHALAKHEQVTVGFDIDADGSISHVRVVKASSPEVEEFGLNSVRDAAPYPPPPAPYRDCFVDQQFSILFVSMGPVCDPSGLMAYADSVAKLIARKMAVDPFAYELEKQPIELLLTLDGDGTLKEARASMTGSKDAVAKAIDAAEALSPFPAPDESLRACISGSPFKVWIKNLGI